MQIGVNTFGLRAPFYRNRAETLEILKSIGISSVEVCVFFPSEEQKQAAAPEPQRDDNFDYVQARAAIWGSEDAPQGIWEIRNHGLAVFSAHAMFDGEAPETLPALIPQIKNFAHKTGIDTFVYSPMKTPDALLQYIPAFDTMSRELAEDNIRFLLHNHERECMLKGDKTGLQLVLEACPMLGLELDVGWAKFAGRDCLQLMDALRDRLVLLHLKDIRPDASPQTRNSCCTATGEGSIPLSQILRKAKELGLSPNAMIIDQDDSDGDILSDIAKGVGNIRRAWP